LNEDLCREYQAIIAYVVYSHVVMGAKYTDIAAQLEIHAKQECVDNRGCFRSLLVSSRGTADETYSLRAKCRELKERIDGCEHQPPNL
jgi:hypothetical protein